MFNERLHSDTYPPLSARHASISNEQLDCSRSSNNDLMYSFVKRTMLSMSSRICLRW